MSVTPVQRLAAVLVLLTAAHIAYVVAGPLDLSGDEAQYWTWSRHLDLGYHSKPPLIAYVIRGSCAIFGDTPLGVRFPAMLFADATAIVVFWLTRRLFNDDRTALRAVLLLGAMPLFMAGTLMMTTDAPLIFFWTLATAFAATDRPRAAGVAMGFGLLSKYTMLLWPIGLLFTPMRRRAWIPVVIALPFLIPMIVWNAQHGWVTLANISGDVVAPSPAPWWKTFGELVGGQVLAVGPVMILMAIAPHPALRATLSPLRGARGNGSDIREVGARENTSDVPPLPACGERVREAGVRGFLLAMSLPYLALLTLLSFHTKIEVNWTAPAYIALAMLAAETLGAPPSRRPVRRLPAGTLAVAIVVYAAVAIVAMHFSTLFYPLLGSNPRRFDPTCRLRGWRTLGAEVSRVRGNLPIVTDNHYVADLLSFYVEGHPPVARTPSGDCIYVGPKPAGFDVVEPLPPVVIRAGGHVIASFPLWHCRGYNRALRRRIDVSDHGRGDEPAS